MFASLIDLHAWWSPHLWVILSHHERLGTQLSKGNGLFCIIPVILSALQFLLPLNDLSAVYGNYHCFHTFEDSSFSGTLFFFLTPPPLFSWISTFFRKVGRKRDNGEQLIQWGEELHCGGQPRWGVWLHTQRTALPNGTKRNRGTKQNWGNLWGYSRTLQSIKNITNRW